MLCHMRDGAVAGSSTLPNGRPITPKQLTGMVGEQLRFVARLLPEREDGGVLERSHNGAYVRRRSAGEEGKRRP